LSANNSAWNNSAAVNLSLSLLQRQLVETTKDGKKLAVLLVPTAAEVASNERAYASYFHRAQQIPGICLIDPFAALWARYQAKGSLNAPNQHFNAAGNAAIAAAVLTAIRECEL